MMSMLDAALAYARQGWPVFPCSPNGKHPLIKSQVKGEGGLKLATRDQLQIREWWGAWPDAMIGVPTGRPIGMFAIDLDPKGDETPDDLMRAMLDVIGLDALPDGPVSKTPRGGQHIWFAMPSAGAGEGIDIRNRGAVIRTPGGSVIDVRGTDGYVIVPPSVRRGDQAQKDGCDGIPYEWLGDIDLTQKIKAPPAPPEIITFVIHYRQNEQARPRTSAQTGPRSGAAPVKRPADMSEAREKAIRKYGLAALDTEISKVERAPDGTRNNTLNEAALKLGHLVGAGALSESVVRGALEAAASAWPNLRKSLGTIDSGLRAGMAAPADLSGIGDKVRGRYSGSASAARLPARQEGGTNSPSPPDGAEDEAAGPPPPAGGEDGQGSGWVGYPGGVGGAEDERYRFDLELARLPLTDLGNSKRFLARFGADFRWCKELGWLAWDGRRWRVEGEDKYSVLLLSAAISTVELIKAEADALTASREGQEPVVAGERWGDDFLIRIKRDGTREYLSDRLRAWGTTSQSAGKISAFPPLARKKLKIDRNMLDGDPWSLTVMNGTLRIKHGEALEEARRLEEPYITLTPHRRDDLSTHLAPVEYNPDATCPGYDRFLAKVQPEADMRRALHQWAGMSGTGNTGTRAFVWHYGPQGSNGKSTWANAIRAVYGDYALQIKIETILNQGRNRRGGEATPDLAELPGVRAIFCSEPEAGAEISENLIKDLTGGDPISCRTLYGPMFRFEMVGKLSVNGNHEPKLRSTDDAIWGRLKIVPWLVSIAEGDPERKSPEYFNALWVKEGSGILNRLLDGLVDWLDNGLTFPAAVAEATAEHRADSDVVGTFIDQCLQRVPPDFGCRVQSTRMHQLYCAWAKANGHRENSQKWFKEKMEEKGFTQIKSSVVFWQDVHLLYAPTIFVTAEGDVVQHASPPIPSYFQPAGRDIPPTREDV